MQEITIQIKNNKQQEALNYLFDKSTNELLYGGGAGGGKSWLGCAWLIICCNMYPETRWLMGRARLKRLKETTLNTFFDVCRQWGISTSHYTYNAQSNIIKWQNGSEIMLMDLFAYPSDPNFDSLGSLEITGAFIDEVPEITELARNIVISRIRYRLDDYGIIPKILMTCNPSKSWPYRDYYKPYKEGSLLKYKKFIQALVTDNPYISEHYRENLTKLDTVSKERLLFGNWEYDDDPAALIEFDAIQDLFTNEHIEDGPPYITADIARFGQDKTIIMRWQGYKVAEIVTLDGSSTTDTANKIIELSKLHDIPRSKIIVDEDGVGGGVKDQIRNCKGFINNSKPLKIKGKDENFTNLKSQCYYKLADYINKRCIFVPTDNVKIKEMLTQELEQVKAKDIDKDGKLSVIPKEKVKELIGRSPDISDALMMRLYFDINKRSRTI